MLPAFVNPAHFPVHTLA